MMQARRCHTHRDTHGRTDRDSDSDANRNTHGHADCDADDFADRDADGLTDPDAGCDDFSLRDLR